ncbi:MAG: rhomboid family intramembrane serine protease [Planctomycetes bacterium]|nr:rhomboid family intramembrane serine protease [Planctomycetota bacterium]
MSWADRRYDDYEGFQPRRSSPSNALFWLLGTLVGTHVLKVILVGVGSVPIGWTEKWFGVSGHGLLTGYLWQPLTYQFVHGDAYFHVLINVLVLFFAGRILEPIIGSARTVVLCLGCGAAASFATFFPGVGDGIPTVGISGGISALWVIAWCKAPNLRVNVIIAVVHLKWVCMLFLLLDVIRAFGGGHATFGSVSGVAYWCHLVGAFAGFCVAFVWPRLMKPRMSTMQAKVKRKRQVARLEKEMVDERELDRILAKINTDGMNALSDSERRFLQRRATRSQGSKRH